MATQRETILMAKPFTIFLISRGWHIENLHGNQYQQGLPDKYICHLNYTPRWIEFKVWNNGSLHLTPAQRKKFPILISLGVPIYVIVSDDLRGNRNLEKRKRLYQKLFDEPNAHFALNPKTYFMLK